MVHHNAKKRLTEFMLQGKKVLKLSLFHGEGWSCWLGKNKCEDFIRQKLHNLIYKKGQENTGQEKSLHTNNLTS